MCVCVVHPLLSAPGGCVDLSFGELEAMAQIADLPMKMEP